MTGPPIKADANHSIIGSGEMATLIRAHNWAGTSLGPALHWSQTLIATVNLVLQSPFPTILAWGPDLVLLYNDAAIPTLAAKHPGALGALYQNVFHEAWDAVGPDVLACLNQGISVVRDNIFIPIVVNGVLEDHYWSYSLIPIYENGVIRGVFDAFRNMTETVESARKLKESEKRLRLATSVAKLGVFEWDTIADRGSWEDKIIYETFGRSPEEGPVNGAEFINNVVHPDYREAFQQAMAITLTQGKPFFFEGYIHRRDGTMRFIEVVGELQPESGQSKGKILGTIRDITEIRQSAERLRETAKHVGELAAIVSSSDDVILSKDLNGIVTSWNEAATRIFGYTAEEMIGTSILKLIPEHLYSDEKRLIDLVRAGNRVEHFETIRVTKNGVPLDVSLTLSPIKDEEGNVIGASKILRDITPRKQIEQTQRDLSKRSAELAAIVESSDDVIISKDLNGIVTSWNASATRVFGYAPEEMIGQSILKLIPPDLQSDEARIIQNIRAGKRIEHFETIRRTKDGRLIDVSLTISPIKDTDGQIIGASKILRDVSDRRRIEESLLQAEKIAATGRMAATIAHEINNPLEAVVNLLYLLRSSVTDSEGIGYLSSAENELGRVSHIAKQTLGYYREHAAAVPAALSDIVEQASAIYAPRCAIAGITIKKTLDSATRLTLRRGEMMQVISNLIANAIYSMPDGGTLSLSAQDVTSPKPGVLLSIADNGVGIPPEVLPRVFDAFFTTRATIGTGIGLFVAKQFVESHGGQITIDSSTHPTNHGTAVSVFMPLHTAYEDTAPS